MAVQKLMVLVASSLSSLEAVFIFFDFTHVVSLVWTTYFVVVACLLIGAVDTQKILV